MRKLLVLAALLALAGPATAEDAKLKVGDTAPPVKATKWLQGAEVKAFEAGKVYVIEFWATWCGLCLDMMPHLGELQSQYKGKVAFVAFAAKDDRGTTLEKVHAFVEKRGPKLGGTFAYADNRDTYDAWMTAAERGTLPCSFVVDGAGKIAYIGHPMYLDVVLPKVVEGKWTAADFEAVKEIEKDVDAVFRSFGGEPATTLKTLAAFEKKYPPLAHIPYFAAPKIGAMIRAEQFDEAQKAIEAVIARAVKLEDPAPPRNLVRMLIGPDARANKELLALAVKAAEASLKLSGERDAIALYYAAEAHFANGDRAKAKEFGSKAVAAADDGLKKQLEGLVKKYDDKKE